ncbi:hypothetical protein YC2023_103282 [Brassica napus]
MGRKSCVNVIDAKTMSSEPVAVVELPHRVPYGFHALFVTEFYKRYIYNGTSGSCLHRNNYRNKLLFKPKWCTHIDYS